MDDDRFILLPIALSVLDVREHMRLVNEDSDPNPGELRYMIDLTYRLVPACRALEDYATLMAGEPALN